MLNFLPFSEIGGTLFAAGFFDIAWDYFDGKDKEGREDERIRRLLTEAAPDFRDAVVRGFTPTSVIKPFVPQSAGTMLTCKFGSHL